MKLAILTALVMSVFPVLSADVVTSVVVVESGSPAIDQLVDLPWRLDCA